MLCKVVWIMTIFIVLYIIIQKSKVAQSETQIDALLLLSLLVLLLFLA